MKIYNIDEMKSCSDNADVKKVPIAAADDLSVVVVAGDAAAADNVGITRLATRSVQVGGAVESQVFVEVANFGPQDVECKLATRLDAAAEGITPDQVEWVNLNADEAVGHVGDQVGESGRDDAAPRHVGDVAGRGAVERARDVLADQPLEVGIVDAGTQWAAQVEVVLLAQAEVEGAIDRQAYPVAALAEVVAMR